MLLFSMGRTPQREREFQWIGPIVPYTLSFFAYGDTVPVIEGYRDLAPVPDLNLPYFAEHLGLYAPRFRHVYTIPELSSTGLYLATGLQTPAQIVERLRDALTIVQDSGFIEQTRQRYLDR